MKNCFILGIAFFVLVSSCKEEKNDNQITEDNIVVTLGANINKFIIGEWITETHILQGNKGTHSWEIINFTSTTQATINGHQEEYIDGELKEKKENINVTVSCSLEGNTIKMMSPSGSINRSLTVSVINELDMLTTDASGRSVKYSKIVGGKMVVRDSLLPDYQAMLPEGAHIKSYKTDNENVVNVNEVSGVLYAVASGITYIFIETNKGTAVVQTEVRCQMETNYESLIGKPKNNVILVMGSIYTESSSGSLIYNSEKLMTYDNFFLRNTGNWSSREVIFDENGDVECISLYARDDVWFSPEELTDYLSKTYTFYEKASGDVKKTFLNANSLTNATVLITWDTDLKNLCFTKTRNDIIITQDKYLPDYTGLFGDIDILTYRTENDFIAQVDNNGIITGIDSGNTNIVIVANQGTFILPVQVRIFLAKDYESLLGVDKIGIYDFFNTFPSTNKDDDGYDLILNNDFVFSQKQIEAGNWETIKFRVNRGEIQSVIEVLLTARQDVWFTDRQIIDYLMEKYVYDKNNSTDNSYFFVNNKEEDLVTTAIIWNATDKTLKFTKYTYF